MFLASKTAWAVTVFISGIVFIILLTTGIAGPRPTPLVSRSSLSRPEVAAAQESAVKQMQQSLRDKGHYRGKVDGVIGLRTRAGIRAYQKAENLPVTGKLDSETAGKLGVEPESSGAAAGHEIKKGKPSACIKWTEGMGRASKKPRKEVSRAAGPESNHGERE